MNQLSDTHVFGETEEELRLIALWRGEAAKEWWTRLDDAGRASLESLYVHESFLLGWVACRAHDLTKKMT
jgi:hypothetical protein